MRESSDARLVLALGTAAVLLLLIPLSRTQPAAPMTVWVAPSLQRVGQNDPPGSSSLARIFASLGESESFQIIVRGLAAVGGVTVSVSDLAGPNGAVIAKSNFTLYREHYVLVDEGSPNPGGSNAPLGPGLYADGLIPFTDPATGADLHSTLDAVPFTLVPGRNQPFWVDLTVPRSATPGAYTGTFTVTGEQGSVTGTIELTVWNFALPARSTLKSSFHLWEHNSQAAQEELLRHRLSPRHVEPGRQRALIDRFGLTISELGFWSGADYQRCPSMQLPPPPAVIEIRRLANQQQRELVVFNYTADEIDDCPHLFTPLRQWGRNLHEAGVLNLVTMRPVRQLLDDGSGTGRSAVDIWVLLPRMYEQAGQMVQTVLAKGDEVWSYNGLVQEGYSPKWLIDFPPIDFRVQPGFINQSLHLTGLLYWRVDLFRGDPWTRANNHGQFGDFNAPGEGMLVYPGGPAGLPGIVPSMRLKWLRDGVDDFDYIELLKKSGRGDLALGVAREIGPDWRGWTRDPARLEAARQRLGQELDRLGAGAGVPTPPSEPVPALGAAGINRNVFLTWIPSAGAEAYDVYIGTSSSPGLAGTTTSAAFQPAMLQPQETYHWKVVARNRFGTASSEPFWFTTGPDAIPATGPVAMFPPFGSGSRRTFQAVVSDARGASNIAGITLLMNNGPVYLNACWIFWDRAANTVSLSNNDTTVWSAVQLGASDTLRNGQCELDAGSSSVWQGEHEIRLSLALSFTRAFAGDRVLLLSYKDAAGNQTGLQGLGRWTVDTAAAQSPETPP
jgi:hypothetical protein